MLSKSYLNKYSKFYIMPSKILMIYVIPPFNEYQMGYSHGIGFISAVLKQEGHKPSLLLIDKVSKGVFDDIKNLNPDVIMLSCASDQAHITNELSKQIRKEFPQKPLILGGVHATVKPEDAIKFEGIDGIVVGEAEEALLEYIDAIEKKKSYLNIKNFWLKLPNGSVKINELRPLIQDLDSLPFPDREIYDYKKLLKGYYNGLEFAAGRGCPYQCSYCINHILMKKYKSKGKFVRMRSPQNIINEVKQVMKKYEGHFDIVTFQDDTFTLEKEWFREFADLYAKEIGYPYRCNTRVDMLDEEIIKLLKKSNCIETWMGVETGDEEFREKILKKGVATTNEQIIKIFDLCKKYGIKTTAFNMIGLPGETDKSIEKTIALNRRIKADNKMLTIFQPYPGTDLGEWSRERGLVTDKKVGGVYKTTIMKQSTISKRKIEYYKSIFHPAVGGSKFLPLIKIMSKIYLDDDTSLYEFVRTKVAKAVTPYQRNLLKKIVWG